MTEEKLYTIDELMEGKAPGSIIVIRSTFRPDCWLRPFFRDGDTWYGLNQDGRTVTWNNFDPLWRLYTEPKKRKVLRPFFIKNTCLGEDRLEMLPFFYESEDAARAYCTVNSYRFVRMAPDSYAVEVEIDE